MELLLFLPLALAVVAFVLHLVAWWRKEEVARYNLRTRYTFDALGNPEFHYDALTQNIFLPPPGNTAFAPQVILVNGVQYTPKRQERPAITSYNQQTIDAFVVQEPGENISPPALETSEKEVFQLETGEKISLSHQEISDYLTLAHSEKKGKIATFKRIGLSPGGSPAYETWSNYWNSLQ